MNPADARFSSRVYLNNLGLICAVGDNKAAIARRLFAGETGSLSTTDRFTPGQPLSLGEVCGELPGVDHLPMHQRSRSNQLLLAALAQIREDLDLRLAGVDPLRIGVVLGTSTSGIAEGEVAMAHREKSGEWPDGFSYRQQEMAAPAECLADWLGARGPAFTISTACSSGAKALASGRRLLREGLCDLVIAGGVDVLCGLTVNGFSALEAVSADACNPFSRNRQGINIGEGAALFIMSRDSGPVALAGAGETSDAHHISAPAPDGAGAARAMTGALIDAGIAAEAIDYLNLHGTATAQNDRMESLAVAACNMQSVPCSSTKGYTGHALGAAGAIEAGFCWLTLTQKTADESWMLPVQLWDREVDPELPAIALISEPRRVRTLSYAMSNSFAFGGNNIALLLERC
ncbi:beta-ketoacyl-ACP synthase [Proteobacteria bacterium 005FR1]|nr:beta-ketoacyl-ACP synthase [Proteobacteria bacterium 005FR1]